MNLCYYILLFISLTETFIMIQFQNSNYTKRRSKIEWKQQILVYYLYNLCKATKETLQWVLFTCASSLALFAFTLVLSSLAALEWKKIVKQKMYKQFTVTSICNSSFNTVNWHTTQVRIITSASETMALPKSPETSCFRFCTSVFFVSVGQQTKQYLLS